MSCDDSHHCQFILNEIFKSHWKEGSCGTLATLILLSYAKLLEVIFKALAYADLQYQDGSHTVVWLPDAILKYFSDKHIIAVVVIMLIGLPYTVLVFTWQ